MTGVRFDHVVVRARSHRGRARGPGGRARGRAPRGRAEPRLQLRRVALPGRRSGRVLEPRGEGGFLHRFLARHGPGIHHVSSGSQSARGVATAPRRAATAWLATTTRIPPGRRRTSTRRKRWASWSSSRRVLRARSRAGRGCRRPAPRKPPRRPSPSSGPRMRARASERPRFQWGEVLGGRSRPAPTAGCLPVAREPHAHRRHDRSGGQRGPGRDRVHRRSSGPSPRWAAGRRLRPDRSPLTRSRRASPGAASR